MRRKPGGSRLFFIEFLIVLFFFLIITTICIRLFVHAHQTSQQSKALYGAQNAAASIIEKAKSIDFYQEYILVSNNLSESMAEDADRFVKKETCYYNSSFAPCTSENSSYTLTTSYSWDKVAQKQSGHDIIIDILVTDAKGADLYSLSTVIHQAATKKEVLS